MAADTHVVTHRSIIEITLVHISSPVSTASGAGGSAPQGPRCWSSVSFCGAFASSFNDDKSTPNAAAAFSLQHPKKREKG